MKYERFALPKEYITKNGILLEIICPKRKQNMPYDMHFGIGIHKQFANVIIIEPIKFKHLPFHLKVQLGKV